MQKSVKQKIVIIGCGNLALHIARHLAGLKKFELVVYNHKPNKALNEFKTKLNCITHSNLSAIIPDAAYYVICVSDKYIGSVSEKLSASLTRHVTSSTAKVRGTFERDSAKDIRKHVTSSVVEMGNHPLILHTSGSTGINKISKNVKNKAVFYPLQTFSRPDKVDWAEVPVIIEANNANSSTNVKKFAGLFSKKIVQLNSAERLKLHLAAVMVNNFTNALFTEADNFITGQIKNANVNFKLLLPLINRTTSKLKDLSPAKAQTGPAKRKDKVIIKKHLAILPTKDLKKLYKQLTALIKKQQK